MKIAESNGKASRSEASQIRSVNALSVAVVIIVLATAPAFTGCEEKKTRPPEQADEALNQAQMNVERADDLISEMRRRSEELEKKIEQQRAALDALIEKRLVLLRQQVSDYEQRLYRLPATKENELKPTLADLNQRLEALAEKFRVYRDAPPAKTPEALQQLETDLKEIQSSFDKFDADFRSGSFLSVSQ